jgi:hypothetical protein
MEEATSPQVNGRVGGVIEASTTGFTTQCYELYEAPPLGSLVRCGEDGVIYGIVYNVTTRGMDQGRRPIARGRDEETEEAVYLSNPQLRRLLVTEFEALSVGHLSEGRVLRYLAPLPPRIHSFVHRCDSDELRDFSGSLDFIPALLSAPIAAPDDVVTSFLRLAGASHPDPERFLIDAGKELAIYLAGKMQRLNNVLRRLSP